MQHQQVLMLVLHVVQQTTTVIKLIGITYWMVVANK